MKQLLLFLTFLISLSGFSQGNSNAQNNDRNKIAILYDRKGGEKITLSDEELKAIDSIFKLALEFHNSQIDTSRSSYFFLKAERYYRQYLPFLQNGEKKVFINCFCGDIKNFPYWRKQQVIVNDGGSCFFSVLINLTTKQYSDLDINGVG